MKRLRFFAAAVPFALCIFGHAQQTLANAMALNRGADLMSARMNSHYGPQFNGSGEYYGTIVADHIGAPLITVGVTIRCENRPLITTTSNWEGRFYFEMKVERKEQNMKCSFDASGPGFTSDPLTKAVRQFVNFDIGTMHIHRIQDISGTMFSIPSASAPEEAIRQYKQGITSLSKSNWHAAEKKLKTAVDIYPQYAEAWYALAQIEEPEDVGAAKESLTKAIASDSQFILPYVQLASIEKKQKDWASLAGNSAEIVKLCPAECPTGWWYNAIGNYYLGKTELAETSARNGLAADTKNQVPELHQILAVILIQKGELAGAEEQLQDFLKLAPDSPNTPAVRAQLIEIKKKIAETKQSDQK